jgi:ADP-heptose:LPS heptosyltransferase
VLSLCRGFIGADGGAMHIAAGLGLPVVALFEDMPEKIRHWHPWHVPYEIVSGARQDVSDITVEQVAQAWARVSSRPS